MWVVLIPTSYRKRFQLNHQNKSIRKLRRLRRISRYSLQMKNSRPFTSSPECCHISIGKGSYLNRNMWPELIGSMICGCNKAVCHVCQRKISMCTNHVKGIQTIQNNFSFPIRKPINLYHEFLNDKYRLWLDHRAELSTRKQLTNFIKENSYTVDKGMQYFFISLTFNPLTFVTLYCIIFQ